MSQGNSTVGQASINTLFEDLDINQFTPPTNIVNTYLSARTELRNAELEMRNRVTATLAGLENLHRFFSLAESFVYHLSNTDEHERVSRDEYVKLWDLDYVHISVSAHVNDGYGVFDMGFSCPIELDVDIPNEYRVSRDNGKCKASMHRTFEVLQDGEDAINQMVAIIIDGMLKMHYGKEAKTKGVVMKENQGELETTNLKELINRWQDEQIAPVPEVINVMHESNVEMLLIHQEIKRRIVNVLNDVRKIDELLNLPMQVVRTFPELGQKCGDVKWGLKFAMWDKGDVDIAIVYSTSFIKPSGIMGKLEIVIKHTTGMKIILPKTYSTLQVGEARQSKTTEILDMDTSVYSIVSKLVNSVINAMLELRYEVNGIPTTSVVNNPVHNYKV